MFGVVSDSLKMLFPRATTRPLKAMEAYRVAVMGLHRKMTFGKKQLTKKGKNNETGFYVQLSND